MRNRAQQRYRNNILNNSDTLSFLFANGELGAWYDPNKLSTLFQDRFGTTPAEVGDNVARINDLSGNAHHLTNSSVTTQPSIVKFGGWTALQFDLYDDFQSVTMADGLNGQVFVAGEKASYVVDLAVAPTGTFTMGPIDWTGSENGALIGAAGEDGKVLFAVAREGDFTDDEVDRLRRLSVARGGGDILVRADMVLPALTNAVNWCWYDTTEDSDGGAWRHRCTGTSWFNETLNTSIRGSRREFPAVALIVAEANKVTIYDGDDPALPMWMVFETLNKGIWITGLTGVVAKNAEIHFSGVGPSYFGWASVNLVSETFKFATNSGQRVLSNSVVQRNSTAVIISTDAAKAIVSSIVNDVAMAVLPDAPVDPATGLPVPTIAVATTGGVSVIKDDGTVADSASTLSFGRVNFDAEYGLWFSRKQANFVTGYAKLADFLAGDGFGDIRGYTGILSGTYQFNLLTRAMQQAPERGGISFGGSSADLSAVSGLMRFIPNTNSFGESMGALTTSTYNTGWLPGDIKGAFLASTDTTSLVGSGELVTNGTFDTDTGWTKGSGWTIAAGVATHAPGIGSDIEQSGGVVAGKLYVLTLNVTAVRVASSLYVMAGSTNTYQEIETLVTVGTKTATFVAPANGKLAIRLGSISDADIDNVSVKLADADRSAANKGLIVNGTITRSPVATGAELVGYSGFSASNFLEQPYNSALDFGTGNFCVMGWVKGNDTYCGLVDRGTGTVGFGGSFAVGGNATPKLFAKVGASTGYSSADVWSNTWRFVSLVRTGGVAYLYVDGAASGSFAAADSVTNASAITRIGLRTDGAAGFDGGGSLALWRISATAPTADQIRRIYEDEKVLFQENAACTLYGASDAVTALAHDPDTGLLHVGTSAGRSVFKGLRRVANTTFAVTTGIAAKRGLVASK